MSMKRWMVVCGVVSVLGPLSAWAYRPPTDTKAGVTLTIEGFPDTSDKDSVKLRKVPTGQPLEFTVMLKNDSAKPVQGELKLWLNDDWSLVGSPEVRMANGNNEPVKGDGLVAVNLFPAEADSQKTMLALDSGQRVSVSYVARPKQSVLSALYPVHARFTFKADGEEAVLHPIAFFEAVKPAGEKIRNEELGIRNQVGDGVLRLDKASWRTGYSQKGKTVDLGFDFSGGHQESGTHSAREASTRGGVQRAGFAVHPPWRNGPGVAWNDFSLDLPKGKPASLLFHTAIRDSHADEPQSDGVEFKVFVTGEDGKEKELFTRFSDSKSWEAASVDLGAYAGQRVTLRLWTGPGPKDNTTCDQSYWGDPLIAVGVKQGYIPTETQWNEREEKATRSAKAAVTQKPSSIATDWSSRLKVNGQPFGVAVALGGYGLLDGVIVFSDGTNVLIYRGFLCDVDRASIGWMETDQPVQRVDVETKGGALIVSHHIARPEGNVVARARVYAEQGALRIAWDMPNAKRDSRGSPRFTRLALGPCSEPVWRVYSGFGYVAENPSAFRLNPGGFNLSTRHVGADYPNGLSLLQATDVCPDHAVHVPPLRRFGLETAHDATFTLVPSAKGAFDAARAFRDICGYPRGKGMDALGARMCIDQWGGDYRDAAKGLAEAARYGLHESVFVKHVWQRWGYDYRLPEIYPPRGDMAAFTEMREAARAAGMLFCPHDNYIDFYPDAEGYSYDHICFTENGQPVRAWYNQGAGALSYRWLPHTFRPWMEANMKMMRDGFKPDSLFIDVFTSIPPFDYYDRAGNFYPSTRTVKEWADAFDTCRAILKRGSPMISEGGHDALIGSVDAGQSDHVMPSRIFNALDDAERTPWHDMVTHGKMVLFAGGLGNRYSAKSWEDDLTGSQRHGYASDDYLSNTVIGGRNPMCDGPFSRRTVMTYWLLHPCCKELAAAALEAHQFGDTIHQQHTTFSGNRHAWANRGSNLTWRVADGIQLPEYGFYVKTPKATAGVVLIDGQRAAFSKSDGAFFADARPPFNPSGRERMEATAKEGRYLGNGAFEVTAEFRLYEPAPGYSPFVHICHPTLGDGNERILFQAAMPLDAALLERPGTFSATIPIRIPGHLPAGAYTVRYGFYRPNGGDRLSIAGHLDGTSRVRGGELHVEKGPDGFTQGRYVNEATVAAEGLNTAGKMLDFGGVATDGAFRLLHGKGKEWTLIPLPGSRPFKADLSLQALGAPGKRKVKAIEMIDSRTPDNIDWAQDGQTLRIRSCNARSFAYKIIFE